MVTYEVSRRAKKYIEYNVGPIDGNGDVIDWETFHGRGAKQAAMKAFKDHRFDGRERALVVERVTNYVDEVKFNNGEKIGDDLNRVYETIATRGDAEALEDGGWTMKG